MSRLDLWPTAAFEARAQPRGLVGGSRRAARRRTRGRWPAELVAQQRRERGEELLVAQQQHALFFERRDGGDDLGLTLHAVGEARRFRQHRRQDRGRDDIDRVQQPQRLVHVGQQAARWRVSRSAGGRAPSAGGGFATCSTPRSCTTASARSTSAGVRRCAPWPSRQSCKAPAAALRPAGGPAPRCARSTRRRAHRCARRS